MLNGIVMFYSTVLNADKKFALASLVPAFVPVCAMLCLVIFYQSWGIYALAVGTVVGVILEVIVLAVFVSRRGLSLLPCWHGMDDNLKAVMNQYLPMVAGAFFMSSTNLVDSSMAAMLAPGSVASLNYGNKVVALILGLGTAALATAVLPHFSTMVAKADWDGIRHTLKTYSNIIMLLTIPVSIVLIFFSHEIIVVLFERGKFSANSTSIVANLQSCYALQIPFYTLGILGVRLLSAMRMNQVLMWVGILSFIVNLLGNYFFMKFWGVFGIALSTTTVYVISAMTIFYCVLLKLDRYKYEKIN